MSTKGQDAFSALPDLAAPAAVLHGHLCRTMTREVLDEAFGEGVVPAPKVSVGGTPSRPPFACDVAEVPSQVTFEQASTCPAPTVWWTQEVALTATGGDLSRLGAVLSAWCQVVATVLMADRTLSGTVHECHLQSEEYGTATDGKGYVAACVIGVRCQRELHRIEPAWKEVRP
ncbi:hypothetical protein [Caniella muris]|uniref:hypothetical protein n=1 Tax=Caniella muris TaxID=2941502 RepID=UPI00203D357E|nr:hypothetical protein [Caniella muris]